MFKNCKKLSVNCYLKNNKKIRVLNSQNIDLFLNSLEYLKLFYPDIKILKKSLLMIRTFDLINDIPKKDIKYFQLFDYHLSLSKKNINDLKIYDEECVVRMFNLLKCQNVDKPYKLKIISQEINNTSCYGLEFISNDYLFREYNFTSKYKNIIINHNFTNKYTGDEAFLLIINNIKYYCLLTNIKSNTESVYLIYNYNIKGVVKVYFKINYIIFNIKLNNYLSIAYIKY